MKKFSALFTLLFIGGSAFGQLSVRPIEPALDSYIYVKGNVLFVNQDINLEKNYKPETEASIYLRREAQLVQGTTDETENSGNGFLSVFQEGTSNAYDYNYWSSPVSDPSPGNEVFGIDLIHSPINETRSLKAGSSSRLNGVASPLNISRQWIYTYSGKDYAAWNHVGHKTNLLVGFGFTMKGVDGVDPTIVEGRENNPGNAQRYDFRGRPNNGNIEVPVATGADVLIGNPYPSALDLSLFLIENSGSGSYSSSCYGTIPRENNITGIAYFWDSAAQGNSHYLEDYIGGYGAFSPVDPCTAGVYEKPIFRTYTSGGGAATGEVGNHYDRRFTPIAQGFMVRSAANSNITFRNRHRIFKKEGENSNFKISDKSVTTEVSKLKVIPKLRFQIVVNDHYSRNLTLAFWHTATNTVDFAMDAKAHSLAPTDAGWLQENESYVIDVRPFDQVAEIPLFLKVGNKASNISFQVRELEDFSTKNIFLHDSNTGEYYSIKEHPYKVRLEPGTYHGRFRISFQNNKIEPPATKTNVDEKPEIFQNNHLGRLEISNITTISIVAGSLYDLSGKHLYDLHIKNKESWQMETTHLPNAVYLVKLELEDGSQLQKKITIHNKY